MSKGRDLGYTQLPVPRHGAPQPKPFRFKGAGTQKAIGPNLGGADPLAPELVPNRREINGRPIGSEEEWNLYQALLYLRIPRWAIDYQVAYRGGRGLGGQVLDFVLELGGAPVVIRVMGAHWHPGEYGSALDVYGFGQLIADGYVVKDIKDTDLRTVQEAVQALKRTNLF